MTWKENLLKGFFRENPIFVIMLGMCPTLGVTNSAINGVGMGLATTAVLLGSNTVISLIRDFIPEKVRIPSFIVVIATFVTIIDLVMAAFVPELHESLGLFIPLIVVNCIILGRAEAFASKHGVGASFIDGLSMGLGFTFALTILGSVREILGSGSIFGLSFVPEGASTVLLFVMPPGAFIALGLLIPAMNTLRDKLARKEA
ncbi:electron transport complex, RnfABCDGE type, E subunit [Spirochaeta thermophila DSM 6578]|uniref:Ion-translocating oxidoreductase complex subunit E n=1 Tax=Winmispira thermophila (strain ATCC 700085 / DSM 6578 / Z-1203) TaxID=869211 RepID=G0GBR8_WINT7|nr:electron transport complex subunit E [Spirochaeta thermophila]AEJ61146.1 electron transport complex, RnfABCDGE type, E subunit [Spirochaeta thermophila DSM 6578]